MELDQLTNPGVDALFSSTYSNQQQLDSLSKQTLSNGIELYMNGDFKGAIKEFKRSIGLSPFSQYMVDTSKYMANAYIQLGETENAIDTYEKAIKLAPNRDDLRITLGNMLFSLDRFDEAKEEYKEAVRVYPSSNNHFSLGQAYLRLEQYNEAETVFAKVRSMDTDKPNGDYGLGLTYSKQGLYEKALEHFQETVNLDDEFYDGYAEIGYAYTDLGLTDEAELIKDFLYDKDPSLAATLSEYMYQKDSPSFISAYYAEAFGAFQPKTPLSTLSTYLEAANSTKTFTLNIGFDKQMDRTSVENIVNWNISRASGTGGGEAYNFGLALPSTEVSLSVLPVNVYYDEDAWTATVKFNITQNATADGTLDPSHVEFKFSGEDIYGNEMDAEGDQYCGFSGIA